MNKTFLAALLIIILIAAGAGIYFFVLRGDTSIRSKNVVAWIRHPEDHPDWSVAARDRCENAPFIFPTTGFIGYLWDDSFRPGHRHQGLDIFSGTDIGVTPVYAAYDGYLTRLNDWKSTVIIRIPQDPTNPARQIWTYYTHMADQSGETFIVPSFPAGTFEKFVAAGTLLGYQGNFSGTPGSPVGTHLHFSIVKDDGNGDFLNELEISNTLDPSPYFNINLNARQNNGEIPTCP